MKWNSEIGCLEMKSMEKYRVILFQELKGWKDYNE